MPAAAGDGVAQLGERVPATANPWLLKDLLRDQWGFKGITISDHGAIKELIKHGVAADGATRYARQSPPAST